MPGTHDPRSELDKAQKLVEGKGFFGWLTRLFMPKSAREQMQSGVKMAQDSMDTMAMHQRVLASGESARATVKSIEDTGALVNYDPVVLLSLEVRPDAGAPFETTIQTPVSKVAIPRAGDEIDVKYNPSNTSEIAIVS